MAMGPNSCRLTRFLYGTGSSAHMPLHNGLRARAGPSSSWCERTRPPSSKPETPSRPGRRLWPRLTARSKPCRCTSSRKPEASPPNWCPFSPTCGTLRGGPFTTRAGKSTPSLPRTAKWHRGWTLPTRWRCRCASWEGKCRGRKPCEAACCDMPRPTRLQPAAP